MRFRSTRVLVLGGARSGKSTYAETLLRRYGTVDYVACGLAATDEDPEWRDRIEVHRARRPSGWNTIETTDLVGTLAVPGPPVLIDCLTTWLAQVMDHCGTWAADAGADAALLAQVDALVVAWRRTRRRVVVVSNEVGAGVVPPTPAGRRFRDEMGILNARIAAEADRVWLVTAGLPQRLR